MITEITDVMYFHRSNWNDLYKHERLSVKESSLVNTVLLRWSTEFTLVALWTSVWFLVRSKEFTLVALWTSVWFLVRLSLLRWSRITVTASRWKVSSFPKNEQTNSTYKVSKEHNSWLSPSANYSIDVEVANKVKCSVWPISSWIASQKLEPRGCVIYNH